MSKSQTNMKKLYKFENHDLVEHERDGVLEVKTREYVYMYKEYTYLLENNLWYLESDLNLASKR